MIEAPILTWQEPMAASARRLYLRNAMRQLVVPAYVLDGLRQERANRVKAASTIAGSATHEEAGT
jgi:hypothetical protein